MVIQLLSAKQDGEPDGDGDGSSSATAQSQVDPPPSYDAYSTPHTSLSDAEGRMSPMQDAFSRKGPVRAPSIDPIAGSSSQSLPLQRATSRAAGDEQRESFPPNPHGFSSSPDRLQQPSPPVRPQPANPMRSSSDPRFRSMQAHVLERDQFGSSFQDESPFAAARRAQLGENGSGKEADRRVYANGHMPSFKPGDIVPVNTMRLATTNPPFILPHEAPSFPPMQHHAPIRPAHFPPEFHPTPPPQQLSAVSSHQHPQQTHMSPPFRSSSVRQPQPASPPQHHASSPPPMRSVSYHRPPSAPLLPQSLSPGNAPLIPPHAASVPSSRSLSPNPPGLMPNGQHANPQTSHPHRHSNIPQDQGYPRLPPSGHPSSHPSGVVPHAPQSRSQPGPPVLRPTQRYSDQPSPSHLQFAPAPVRLPSENIRPQSVQALGIVHQPPNPSSSPRPDPSRPPRITPKPVMPQPLAPLSKQEANYGRAEPKQLQRSVTVVPTQKGGGGGGFLSKTKSILRKRTSTPGIQTHADGAISLGPRSYSSSKQDIRAPPALTTVKEEQPPAGGIAGKISKRLSKK